MNDLLAKSSDDNFAPVPDGRVRSVRDADVHVAAVAVTSIALVVIACGIFIGWQFRIELLKSPFPETPDAPQSPLCAFCWLPLALLSRKATQLHCAALASSLPSRS